MRRLPHPAAGQGIEAAITERRAEKGKTHPVFPPRKSPRMVASWLTLILISWMVFSGMVYLGFSAFEEASRLVAGFTDGNEHPRLDAIAPAAGEPMPRD
ncbi:MAG: hypothetical protein AB7K86_20220 [Rhodospirillales bacterium]